MKKKNEILSILIFVGVSCYGQTQIKYKTPPKEIVSLVDAPQTPSIMVDPTGSWLIQMRKPTFTTINDLARDEIKLAGIRINTAKSCRSRVAFVDSISLTQIKTGKDFIITGVPEKARLSNFAWSPNGRFVAFTNEKANGLELWLLDVHNKSAEKLTNPIVNGVMPAKPVIWADQGEWMVFASVQKNKEPVPKTRSIPDGPIVRESNRIEAAVRTYRDLLKNERDKKLFDFYASSQLIKISINKEQYPIGVPAIFKHVSISPNYKFILVKMVQRPYSYIVPFYRFPFKVEIWDNDGNLYRDLFKIPLAENIPKGFGAVRKGPREIGWRSDKPASLFWVVALDGGDPKKNAVNRDRLVMFDFPFDGKGYGSIAFSKRFGKITWGKSNFAICSEWWWDTRTETISAFNPEKGNKTKRKLFEYNWQDAYNYPGSFVTRKNQSGYNELQFNEKKTALYMKGNGASPQGNKPFIDEYTIESGAKTRLWQSADPYYEYPYAFIDADKKLVLTKRESKTDAPNYFSRNLKNAVVSQLTNFTDPYPQLAKIRKELVTYTRNDGVRLSATLYTPPDFTVGDRMLPVLIWAYPHEYKSAATAGQIKSSPNKFVRIGWWSPIFWVMRGYAVMDNPTMPIIGEGDTEPNDNFIEQLVADGEAAVRCLDSLGIADLDKIAIGGHSYGAFMAANLLAHTNLFAAGIARSGAYNRTLTPFGFQSEQRTFWEARNTYINMSPFSFANKINEPLLLIHGEADNNAGTYPIQSERMFAAIKGNGGKSRLVMLPLESHGYQARESVLHMLWEMDVWLDKYVKQNIE